MITRLFPPFFLGLLIYIAVLLMAVIPPIGSYYFNQTHGMPSAPYHWEYIGGDWPNVLIYRPIYWAPLYIVGLHEVEIERAILYAQPYWILFSIVLTAGIIKVLKKIKQ